MFLRAAILTCCAGLLALSACTIPVADDIHLRGSSSAFAGDTSDYRAMDNAIHDVLVERFGRDRVELVEFPEREHHRWVATSNEFPMGNERHRLRISARPMPGGDGTYEIHVMAREEIYQQGDQFRTGSPPAFGRTPWIEVSRNAKIESEIANEVNSRVRAWRSAGRADPGNRRNEYISGAGGR